MSFELDLAKFARKYDARADALVRKIVIDVGKKLVLKSPVGDAKYWKNPESAPPGYVGGRFRANWQYGRGSYSVKITDDIDPSGASTINAIVGSIPHDAAGMYHYITNSLHYSKRLEDGYSRQAPHGMVHLTIAEFRPIVDAAARALNP